MSAAAPTASPGRALAQMVAANQVQQAIYVASTLGIADLLNTGPHTADEIGRATEAHPDALYRLMRALTGVGLFTSDDDGRFSLTPMGALLRSSDPQSVQSFALWSGGVSYRAFGGLEYSVRTGQPAFEREFGVDFFTYLASDPTSAEVFDEMMARHTAPVAAAIATHQLDGVHTIVDIGGGTGLLLAAILAKHPQMRGVLLEQARVLSAAGARLSSAGVDDRCQIIEGDINDPPPSADAYLLKSVIHGLNDDQSRDLLVRCSGAMNPGGRVMIVELLMPNGNQTLPAALMDLLMLIGCQGRERTAAEFARLVNAAGLTVTAINPIKNGYAIIEAQDAPS